MLYGAAILQISGDPSKPKGVWQRVAAHWGRASFACASSGFCASFRLLSFCFPIQSESPPLGAPKRHEQSGINSAKAKPLL